ncbi:prolyl aminopeptidase [Bifidobacterium dolichotidis]|uniref:Prolyl aminopeptidase n=1 Tax=Bifidobacterium dolichotidis TaxID=2306976 RepID=A0A430FT31_9BIFI|nr:hypothetical protein [Bifidobacterium dolichotidis]RSX56032.1 prolyl aminopeptidase [Bifidobacterium dolichotidis]
MPWWIWLVLAAFWLAMLVIGCIYAIRKAIHAARLASALGNQVAKRAAVLQDHDDTEEATEPAIFTQPLQVASDRYAQAHAEVLRRKHNKHMRHVETWQQWEEFNN